MKGLPLIIFILCIPILSFSQITVGIKGFINFANAESNDAATGNGFTKKGKTKYGGGINAEIGLFHSVSLRTGITYMGKGIDTELPQDIRNPGYKRELDFSVIEIPLVICYSLRLKHMKIFMGIGESTGIGIKGNDRYTYFNTYPGINSSVTRNYNAYTANSSNPGYKPFKKIEISANAIAGLQLSNGLFADIGYLIGLNDLHSPGYKNKGFQLGLGYLFHSRK